LCAAKLRVYAANVVRFLGEKDAEPVPDGDLIDPPEEFSAEQRRIWSKLLANAPAGLLKRLDEAIFASYVVNYSNFLKANAEIERLGLLVRVAKNDAINPYLSIARNANAAMIKAAAELGFTPSSRSRVKVKQSKRKPGVFGRLKELDGAD
jgi:P27 family predicted phage terminase small subunit